MMKPSPWWALGGSLLHQWLEVTACEPRCFQLQPLASCDRQLHSVSEGGAHRDSACLAESNWERK